MLEVLKGSVRIRSTKDGTVAYYKQGDKLDPAIVEPVILQRLERTGQVKKLDSPSNKKMPASENKAVKKKTKKVVKK